MKYEELKFKEPIFRNREDKLTAIFLGLGITSVIIGAGLIYSLLNPAPPITTISVIKFLAIILGIGIAFGIANHGFQPFLLFKQNK